MGSIEELHLASRFPLDRIELCSSLEIGGTTPSQALVEEAVKMGLETHVLIRPRAGDFNYTDKEVSLMKREISTMLELGAKGVVFGLSTEEGVLDSNQELVDLANSLELECTFHRAFDFIEDQRFALEMLVQMGFDRILMSGGVEDRAAALNGCVKQAAGRIQVMVGGGVNSSNLGEFIDAGVDAVHFSGVHWGEDTLKGMGKEFSTDADKLESMFNVLKTV